MSGFEHYHKEIADLDHEIRHYATVCGVDLADRGALEACLLVHQGTWATDKARETLHGLLILRIKLETEMIELGFAPPPLLPQAGEVPAAETAG